MEITTGAGRYDAPDAVRADETFSRAVQERLKLLTATLNDAFADLSMLDERMFGGGAAAGSLSGDKADAPSSGRAGDIFSTLDRLQSTAARIASQARGLNSRI